MAHCVHTPLLVCTSRHLFLLSVGCKDCDSVSQKCCDGWSPSQWHTSQWCGVYEVTALEAFACGFHRGQTQRLDTSYIHICIHCIPESITTTFIHNYVQSFMYTQQLLVVCRQDRFVVCDITRLSSTA